MASTASPASAFPGDHASSCELHLPSDSFPTATTEQDPSPPAAAARKPPRKRPRPSRRPPTTVLTTDASNFHAMVQEFTGFPAPPPHLRPAGALLGSGPSDSAEAAFQLLRPSHLELPAASPHASLANCTTSSLVLDALALFAKNSAMPTAAAGDATPMPSSSSEFYSSYGPTVLARVVPFEDGFEAAGAEGERAVPGSGLLSPPLHAGDWYHRHLAAAHIEGSRVIDHDVFNSS